MWDEGSVEPESTEWVKEKRAWEAREGVKGKWELSSINQGAGVDMGCIRGVEQSVGPWRKKRRSGGKGGS